MKNSKLLYVKLLTVFSILCISTNLLAQVEISGRVIDETNQSLAGVTVVEKGSTNGVATDASGNYRITVSDQNSVLVFSYLGFEVQEWVVGPQRTINVQLSFKTELIEDVVVIGYGTLRKRDLTGSVSSVKAGDSEKLGQHSVENLIQGRAAGVQLAGSNTIGATQSIRIRGTSSINASSEPLYVVDGLPILNGGTRAGSGIESISNIANIDPNTIESIEILKDASATAIYGSQGANGVILITTQQAAAEKMITHFKVNQGFTFLEPNYRSMDAYQYAYYVRNTITNPYPSTHDRIPADPDSWGARFYYIDNWKDAPTTDWLDKVTRVGSYQDIVLSMQGGTEKVRHSASLGYLNNNGIIDYTNFRRYSGDFTSSFNPSEYLSFSLSTKLSYINNDGVISQSTPDQVNFPTGAVMSALSFDPTIPYDPSNLEQYFIYPDGSKAISPAVNLAAQTRNTRRFDGWLSGGMKLFLNKGKNLSFETKFSGRYGGTKNNSFDTKYSQAGMDWGGANGGIAEVGSDYTLYYLWNNLLNYSKSFGKHNISALAGHEYQNNYWNGQSQRSINFPIDLLGTDNLAMADPQSHEVPNTYAGEWTILSYFGRLNYSFDRRYLATLTFRADGSSRFAKNNKWGYFPSGALAWVISEEDFMSSLDMISFLKARVGWGATGNQSINPYQSQALMRTSSAYYPGGQQTMALVPERLANDNLKWESTEQLNFGIDLSLYDSRLSFTIDYYNKITKDLLMTLNIPPSSGFNNILTNIGQISNKGIEILIESRNIVNDNFQWTSILNFARNKNNVDDLGDKGIILSGKTSYQEIIMEGNPLGCWYGLLTDGLWTQDDLSFVRDATGVVTYTVIPGHERAILPGEAVRYGSLKLKDISGPDGVPDGVINDMDRVIIGCSQPKFFGGITNTFNIKNISINVFADYSYGSKVYNHMKQNYVALPEAFNHYAVDYYFPTVYELVSDGDGLFVEDRDKVISNGNPDGKYPINSGRVAGLDGYPLDMFMEDASYLRLKELTLAYNLPSNVTRKLYVNTFQIFFKASNLYTFTKYTGNDPTVVTGRDWNPYPKSRTIQLGANISF